MFEKDGICYAGTPETYKDPICVVEAKPAEDYQLILRFSDDAVKKYDFTYFIEKYPLFKPLRDKNLFNQVRVECGAPVWLEGDIDFDPECLYADGIAVPKDI